MEPHILITGRQASTLGALLTTLRHGNGRVLADVVEVFPRMDARSANRLV